MRLQVDRAKFISTFPYQDSPQSIGYGATISAPHVHAKALEELEPNLQPGQHALDVGESWGCSTDLNSVGFPLLSSATIRCKEMCALSSGTNCLW